VKGVVRCGSEEEESERPKVERAEDDAELELRVFSPGMFSFTCSILSALSIVY
jgi:hypothetical protein